MSEQPQTDSGHIETALEDLEIESSYKPPPEKSLEELLSADKEDESLQKYKEALLGEAKVGKVIVGKIWLQICSTLSKGIQNNL